MTTDPAATLVIDGARPAPAARTARRRRSWWQPLLPALIALLAFYAVTVPAEPAVRWQRVHPPMGAYNPASLLAAGGRFVALSRPTSEGFAMWHSDDGIDWRSSPVTGAPSHLAAEGDELVLFQGYEGVRLAPEEDQWRVEQRLTFPDLVRVGHGSGRPGLVAIGGAVLVQTVAGDLLRSEDGVDYRRVITAPEWGPATGMSSGGRCSPTTAGSIDVVPMVKHGTGLTALVSAGARDPVGVWPVCEPEIWRSTDGSAWERHTDGSPFGRGAFVYDLAWRDGVFVAVGGRGLARPAVWRSVDGVGWEEIPAPRSDGRYELREVESGGLGWVMLGELAGRPGLVGWTSPDGHCWTALPDHVQGRIAAVASERVLVVDRRPPVATWLGVAPSGELRCPPA